MSMNRRLALAVPGTANSGNPPADVGGCTHHTVGNGHAPLTVYRVREDPTSEADSVLLHDHTPDAIPAHRDQSRRPGRWGRGPRVRDPWSDTATVVNRPAQAHKCECLMSVTVPDCGYAFFSN